MKHHKKIYENVFSSDQPRGKARLNLEEIDTGELELNEYASLFHDFLTGFYSDLFLNCVKLSWLRRKFSYHGSKTVFPMYKNSRILCNGFVKFMRRNVGNDIQIITKGPYLHKLESYFHELFPDFESESPFENPDYYMFPYKNISVEYLIIVHQMEDRFELLKFADENEMTYAVFMDYVINHAYCENDRLERDRYQILHSTDGRDTFSIRDTDKRILAKKNKKRI